VNTRLGSRVVHGVWLMALVPYLGLTLTATFPHAHELCVSLARHAPHPRATLQVAAHHTGDPACPLCQWHATSKVSGSGAGGTARHELLPVGAIALLPAHPAPWALVDVSAARAPPTVCA
jgi:hypothetical protein